MSLGTKRGVLTSPSRRVRARSLETHFRSAAVLLLLPLIAVSAVSGAFMIIGRTVADSLRTDQVQERHLEAIQAHLHDVALEGTAFLAARDPDQQAAMERAAKQVDAELAATAHLSSLTQSQRVQLAKVARAWLESLGIRWVILAEVPPRSEPADAVVLLEEQLNTRVAVVSAQADKIQAMSAAHASLLAQDRNIVDQVSPIVVALALLFGLGSAWLLSRRLARSIMLPLSTLTQAAERIAADEQSPRVAFDGPREIQALGSAFNHMADELAERQTAVQRHQQLLALMENASDGIIVISADGKVLFATPGFSAEIATEDAATSEISAHLHPEDRPHVQETWARIVAGGEGATSDVEARVRDKKGEWRDVSVRLTNRIADPSILGVVMNLTDVTERREYEQQLTHQALHDPLTGLANRRLFLQRLETTTIERRKGDPATHSLLYVDFDDFKQINDTMGHKAGDDFLAAMAGRLVDCVRPVDMVARLGGDEYAILLRGTSRRGAVLVVERVIAALGVTWTAEGKEIHPRASIGLVSRAVRATTAETLLADGDLAMYFAKRQGKARYEVYSDTMRSELLERLKLGDDLRAAVETGALTVQYQPIIDMRSGAISGVEALARWQHPTRGWIAPLTFIPLAEEIGLVNRLDMWVLQEACRQGRNWSDEGLGDLRVAVNLSGSDLDSPGLVATVAKTLQETGFPPMLLELELTEGVAIFESGSAQETLQTLKGLGVRLAIDDFGTGYSALGRLRSLPFDRLKIDKVFVDELIGAPDDTTLVETILKMARLLGLEVVAEGVETSGQADFLRGRGCGFAQGYLFSRPVDAWQLEALLRIQHEADNVGGSRPITAAV